MELLLFSQSKKNCTKLQHPQLVMSTELELIDEKQTAAETGHVTAMVVKLRPKREANAWMHLHSRIEEINIQVCSLFNIDFLSDTYPLFLLRIHRISTLSLLRGSASFGKILASNTKNS